MGTAAGMLAEARKSLGLGEPNYIQAEYRRLHGADYSGNFSWCDAAITYWARHSGNAAAVLPGGDRAYTVWHAEDFQRVGRWHVGTAAELDRAQPGDIVFFDWAGSNDIQAIDHVGVIEKVLGGGRVQTIEGNTGDRCLRRVRDASVIVGYGRPAYNGSTSGGTAAIEEEPLLGLKKGDTGERVKALQQMIEAAGQGAALGASGTDGEYGPATAEALRRVRLSVGSQAATKAGSGDRVDAWAFQQLHSAVARTQGKLALHKV